MSDVSRCLISPGAPRRLRLFCGDNGPLRTQRLRGWGAARAPSPCCCMGAAVTLPNRSRRWDGGGCAQAERQAQLHGRGAGAAGWDTQASRERVWAALCAVSLRPARVGAGQGWAETPQARVGREDAGAHAASAAFRRVLCFGVSAHGRLFSLTGADPALGVAGRNFEFLLGLEEESLGSVPAPACAAAAPLGAR